MIEVFVCDDDSTITDFLKFFIKKHFGETYKVVTINRCHELIGLVELHRHVPDLLIMDINLKDGNGIETVKLLQQTHPRLKVIYLTGIIQYATAIFQTNPAYFLVKPIEESLLYDAIVKVSREIEAERHDVVVVKANGSELALSKSDIVYVESNGRKLILHTVGGQYEIYEKMDSFCESLGASFVRSHKSFLINMKYIVERTNQEFCLSDGLQLPISKSNLKAAKLKFISYLGEDL